VICIDKLLFAFHPKKESRLITLPQGKKWMRIVDTSLLPPDDFPEKPTPMPATYEMKPFSSFVAICS